MSTITENKFYLPMPCDEYWNNSLTNGVIEARPMDPSDSSLQYDWQKTENYVQNYLKVVTPKEFRWPHVVKKFLVECPGPSRELTLKEYFELYHSLVPDAPLPKNFYEVTGLSQSRRNDSQKTQEIVQNQINPFPKTVGGWRFDQMFHR